MWFEVHGAFRAGAHARAAGNAALGGEVEGRAVSVLVCGERGGRTQGHSHALIAAACVDVQVREPFARNGASPGAGDRAKRVQLPLAFG